MIFLPAFNLRSEAFPIVSEIDLESKLTRIIMDLRVPVAKTSFSNHETSHFHSVWVRILLGPM
jgi:hypothetical protein